MFFLMKNFETENWMVERFFLVKNESVGVLSKKVSCLLKKHTSNGKSTNWLNAFDRSTCGFKSWRGLPGRNPVDSSGFSMWNSLSECLCSHSCQSHISRIQIDEPAVLMTVISWLHVGLTTKSFIQTWGDLVATRTVLLKTLPVSCGSRRLPVQFNFRRLPVRLFTSPTDH